MNPRALLLVMVGCGSSAPGAVPASRPTTKPVPLVAARETGLFEISKDGRDARRLSTTPAQHPRWQTPGHRLVFLARETRELRSLDLDTAKERVIAQLPGVPACPPWLKAASKDNGESAPVQLDLQDGRDFVVSGTRACLQLLDRNINMANYVVDVRIDLSTGEIADYVSMAPDDCKVPERQPPSSCERPGKPSVADDEEPVAVAGGPARFTTHSASPSGKWVLLSGNESEGDYIHFQVVLYERATQRSFPLLGAKQGAGWPAPLRADQLAFDYEHLYPIAGDVLGESAIYWLDGPEDRLVIDDRLVVPGVRIVNVGQLAL